LQPFEGCLGLGETRIQFQALLEAGNSFRDVAKLFIGNTLAPGSRRWRRTGILVAQLDVPLQQGDGFELLEFADYARAGRLVQRREMGS